MDFGDAISALRAGKRVQRAPWAQSNSWLCFVPGVLLVSTVHEALRKHMPAVVELNLGSYVVLHAAKGVWQANWTPSQSDMFAEDWTEVDDAIR